MVEEKSYDAALIVANIKKVLEISIHQITMLG